MALRNILITGGAGFVPSSLVDVLITDKENNIVVVDNFLTGRKDNIPKNKPNNYSFIKGNVNNWHDISAVMLSQKFDYVFHYAAVVGVKRTLDHPLLVLEDIKGFENILNLSKNTGVKRVFFSSSSEVYGEPVEFPQNEHTTPLNSKLPYAIVKNIGEAYLKSFHKEHGLDYTIFRFFNTYGPKQSSDFVLSKFIKAALAGKDITVFGEGDQTRTFCYIKDNIDVTVKCLYEDHFINDTINIGSSKETTILELAKLVKKLTGSSSKIVHLPPLKEGDMTRRLPDNSSMIKLLGRSIIPLDEGIKNILTSLK